MNKLARLSSLCKCEVSLIINEHKVYYQTAKYWIDEQVLGGKYVAPHIKAGCIAEDNTVLLSFYPDTPIGSYTVIHYDLEAALDEALEIMDHRTVGGL